ncbi:MAG: 50S ribosomal protein L32e [Halobacteria archaeon]
MAEELTDIEGVGESKAELLREAGIRSVEDVKRASQDQLTDIDGVGKALAARIKADIGELEVEEEVEIEQDLEEEEVEIDEEAEVITAAPLSDKSPELDEDVERALRKKNAEGKPAFTRQDVHKKKRVPESWRKPVGSHSRRRKNKKSRGAVVKSGHGSDSRVRGLHPSGFEEVMVHSPEDLEDIDPDTEAARIGGSVGGRKRELIEERALAREIRVLNPTHVETEEDEE